MTREQRRAAAKAKKLAAIKRRNQQAAQPGDLPPTDSEEESDENDDDDDDDDDDEVDLPANPNHTAKSRSQLLKKEDDAGNGAGGNGAGNGASPRGTIGKGATDTSHLSRREREAIEAQQARERYLKLHAEGKTEEARADLARLAIIREKREAERLRKEAEKEERAERERERLAAREEREKKLREAAMGKPTKKPAAGKKKA